MAITNDEFLVLLQSAVMGKPDPRYRFDIEEYRLSEFVVTVGDIENKRVGRFLVNIWELSEHKPEE
jgi:hypothetical protein